MACPFLGYFDVPAAVDWLSSVFGFKLHSTIPSSGKSFFHAKMLVGESVIIIEYSPDRPQWSSPGTHGVYVYVKEVEALFDRAQKAGAKIIRPLEETVWGDGTLYFRVLDPEGYQWSFGNHRPSVDI
jgi:uncharacterized glyoxalase superfamily protein PhnB